MNRVTERNPKIMSGALVFKGTRVPIYRILSLMSAGKSIDHIIESTYPTLNKTEILLALEEVAEEMINGEKKS
jgi:uncharacterized protein (DUF433 family)